MTEVLPPTTERATSRLPSGETSGSEKKGNAPKLSAGIRSGAASGAAALIAAGASSPSATNNNQALRICASRPGAILSCPREGASA